MCNCKDCKGITLLSGNDGKGIVSITYNEENNTITVLYTDGTSYTSPTIGCPCPENVFYSEEVLGPESVGTIDSPIIIDGTTYTVPTGEDGTYRIFYSVQVHFEDFPGGINGQLFIKPLINGTPYTIIRESFVNFIGGGGRLREGTSLNLQLNLNAGDVFALQGSSNEPEVQYLKNATLIIDKLP
jgi:hypothetical protein